MSGILTRWRQFGRRYFWPHLLLGMVAAGFGLPALNNNPRSEAPAETFASLSGHGSLLDVTSLVQIQESARRPTFSVDYWHQHAIRTVIRHLSFVMSPQVLSVAKNDSPVQAQHVALLETLSVLLTRQGQPVSNMRFAVQPERNSFPVFSITAWLGQVRGIRAGPQRFC